MFRARASLFAGIALIVAGVLLRALISTPPAAQPRTLQDLARALEFQRDQAPLAKLPARYHPYAIAFVLAGSESDIQAIQAVIDEELAARDAIMERGLAGVPAHVSQRLMAPDIALIAIGGVLVFAFLAPALAAGFAAGVFHQAFLHTLTLTGSPSELFLASILAGLIWTGLAWAGLRAYARFSGANP
jgi:hypothetical protein